MHRFIILPCFVVALFLAGCSDDDDGSSGSGTGAAPTAAAPTEAPATAAAPTGAAAADALVEGSVTVDFTGSPEERDPIDAPYEVEAGSTAWEAIQAAVGEENLSFDDFGGDLGILITGFEGVEIEGNHFWEFKVNGEAAEVGVSNYEVQDGDVLEFVYSSF